MARYQRIRELREERGMTQREVAEQLEMLQPQYFRYEQGSRDLPTEMLIRLSELYEVSVDYLLGLTENRQRAR
ncbi:MAG: helix-turn-helix transcriptional regulator [Clostridia bacterium]|nr:helix-turn-helix transcriptional regulator [Clostridia bacterium]